MKQKTTFKPNFVEFVGYRTGRPIRNINLDIVELEDGGFEYIKVEVPASMWNYEGITAALINAKYSNDEMQAITNNMTAKLSLFFEELLVGDGLTSAIKTLKNTYNDSNSTAFKDMQIWRKEAKEIAFQALEFARENGLS